MPTLDSQQRAWILVAILAALCLWLIGCGGNPAAPDPPVSPACYHMQTDVPAACGLQLVIGRGYVIICTPAHTDDKVVCPND